MKTVGIIQARMGSSRLPGKVLMDLSGRPMLARVVDRMGRADRLDAVVVATTDQPLDDAVAGLCEEQGWSCVRGSQEDVLDRYHQAAAQFQADVVVRITADCPCIDPDVINQAVTLLTQSGCDYVSNTLPPRTFPRGLDVEVMTIDALERAWREDDNAAWREHVTPYLYRNPQKFRLEGLKAERDHSDWRWTVDTPEDLAFVRRIYAQFGDEPFGWRDVLGALAEHPEWREINRHVPQKTV